MPQHLSANTVPQILSEADQKKIDTGNDESFYRSPRFVTHADDDFLARLTELYASVMSPGDRVFDAMSSWVSFLPPPSFNRVVGHGLNRAELEANEQLDEFFVQDFNADQTLPLGDEQFDIVCCALSVQYLQYPGAIFTEFERILAPGGSVVVSFTNRMFPTKAVRAWRSRSMDERAALVEEYLTTSGFSQIERVVDQPGSDPFYAVIGSLPAE